MNYEIHKSTYSEGLAYRYQMADERGQVHYVVEPTGLALPTPTRLLTLLDAELNPIGRLEPASSSIWNWVTEHSLLLEDEEEPRAVIEERWTIVDRILLRLPSYRITVRARSFIARGTKHGEVFYEIYRPPAEVEETDELDQDEPAKDEWAEIDEDEIPEKLEESEQARWGEKVGEIIRPSAGASYIIKVELASLRQDPLALAALAVLADMHLQEH